MHLEQLPSGRWRAIVSVNGRRRTGPAADSRAEAQRLGARLLLNEGGSIDTAAVTVAELLDSHIGDQPLGRRSRENYEAVRRLYLHAAFEARPVPSVTPPVIDALYRKLEAEGASVHQIRKLHSLLSGAFSRARRMGLVVEHPCRDQLVPAEPEPDVRTPTTEEARALLDACDAKSPAFGLYARLAASTGARPGELVGLQRHDISVSMETVDGQHHHVGELRIVRGIARAKGGLYETALKTGKRGRRVVAIAEGLCARLNAHLLAQDLNAVELDGTIEADTWLFTEDYLSPWYPTTPGHWWREARNAAGITGVRLYDLRHYVATELYAGGFDDQTAMRRLGHTNPVTTGRRYATSRPARDRAAAEYLERELGG